MEHMAISYFMNAFGQSGSGAMVVINTNCDGYNNWRFGERVKPSVGNDWRLVIDPGPGMCKCLRVGCSNSAIAGKSYCASDLMCSNCGDAFP